MDDFFCFLRETDNNDFIEAGEIRDPTSLEQQYLLKVFSRQACDDHDQNFKILFHLNDIAFLADDPPNACRVSVVSMRGALGSDSWLPF
ncbi:MAG: hypothetical protein CMM01_26910 [Rhodopirellula sp.]|nr:hypothetical protein [Rhodopirellula sp.]